MKLKKIRNYYEQAKVIAQQSPDEQTKVGALLIHGTTGAVLSSGYNGFVRGGPDHILPKARPEKYEYMIHAEENLLLNCARHGISTDNCFIFCTLSPCVKCLRSVYQAGITTVFFKEPYSDFEKNTQMKDLHLLMNTVNEDEFYSIQITPRQV